MWQTHNLTHDSFEEFKQISKQCQKVVIGDDGKPQEVILRVPNCGEIAVIDALNVVMHPDTFNNKLDDYLNDSELTEDEKRKHATDTAEQIANVLKQIMGEDFADIQDTGVSRNRYRYTYRIGHQDCPLGLIGIGNFNTNKPTILIMIYGEGCHFANEFWEFGLFCFLENKAIDARITRVDLCHDDFDGSYSSAELADQADTDGLFALTNKLPKVQQLGDWKRHEGAGRTLQVGKRENGKCYRGYEKGKQLGNKESPWFRHEVEIGNKARTIPLDVLLSPSEFFAGAYPYLYEIAQYASEQSNFVATPIRTVKESTTISINKSVEIVKRQFGRYLRVFRDIFDDDSDILDILVTEQDDYYPKRLRLFQKIMFRPPSYFQTKPKNPFNVAGLSAPLQTNIIPFEPCIRSSINAI